MIAATSMRMQIVHGALLAGSLAACSVHADGRALATTRAQWSSHQLAAYSFTWEEQCFCSIEETRAMHVVVTDGQIASLAYADDATPVEGTNGHDVKTIDALFDQIETAISDGEQVSVRFDPVLSYPTSVGISAGVPDSGLTIQISHLQASP